MKAQSELMGDHERTAEMTVPRFCGVTKWITGTCFSDTLIKMPQTTIGDLDTKLLCGLDTKLLGDLDYDPCTVTLGATAGIANFSNIINNNEVNHRPTARQRTVCTP